MIYDYDRVFMAEALSLAKEAYDAGEVPVGAVIVKDGKIIARGRNTRENDGYATHHAEVNAINSACEVLGGYRLTGCTLYVTLEPCPMCAGAIINSRIDRVVYGAADKKGGAAGSLINLFAVGFNHTPKLNFGVMEQECSEILTKFFNEKI